jgi:biotin transporter BioY
MAIASVLSLCLALAFLTESTVEYLFGTVADKFEALSPYKWALMYVSCAIGVALAFAYGVDVLSFIVEGEPTIVGQIATGVVIGRGANYLSDFVAKYLK